MKTLLKNKTGQDVLQALGNQKYEKIKVSTIAATLTALICSATVPSYASDIEIYTKPNSTVGSGVVVMMLDTSGSMSIDVVKSDACDLPSGVTSSNYITETAPGGYTRQYCQVGGTKNIIIGRVRSNIGIGDGKPKLIGTVVIRQDQIVVHLFHPHLLMVLLKRMVVGLVMIHITISLKVLRRIMTVLVA